MIGFNQSSHVFFVLLNEMIFYLSGYDQEGAGPSNDHNVTSAVRIIAGETLNSSERDSEAGNNNSASHHMQGPVADITGELLCGDNVINAPIRLPHYGMYLTPIISQHLDIMTVVFLTAANHNVRNAHAVLMKRSYSVVGFRLTG